MRIIRASCNWERSLSSDLSFFDDTDPGLFNEARIFFFWTGEDQTRYVECFCSLRTAPGDLMHILFIAEQRWLRDPNGFRERALRVGERLLQERMLLSSLLASQPLAIRAVLE